MGSIDINSLPVCGAATIADILDPFDDHPVVLVSDLLPF